MGPDSVQVPSTASIQGPSKSNQRFSCDSMHYSAVFAFLSRSIAPISPPPKTAAGTSCSCGTSSSESSSRLISSEFASTAPLRKRECQMFTESIITVVSCVWVAKVRTVVAPKPLASHLAAGFPRRSPPAHASDIRVSTVEEFTSRAQGKCNAYPALDTAISRDRGRIAFCACRKGCHGVGRSCCIARASTSHQVARRKTDLCKLSLD